MSDERSFFEKYKYPAAILAGAVLLSLTSLMDPAGFVEDIDEYRPGRRSAGRAMTKFLAWLLDGAVSKYGPVPFIVVTMPCGALFARACWPQPEPAALPDGDLHDASAASPLRHKRRSTPKVATASSASRLFGRKGTGGRAGPLPKEQVKR